MITYRSLETATIDELAHCFNAAFSTYEVPVDMTESRLILHLASNSVNLSASMGAYDESRLVGFVLNGSRIVGGRLTAYDAGTGVVPGYQRRGIANALVGQAMEYLQSRGYEKYILEVLEHNQPAIDLYANNGFTAQRRLNCYSCKTSIPLPQDSRMETLPVTGKVCDQLSGMIRYKPSWQNSTESILAIGEECAAVKVHDKDGKQCLLVLHPGKGSLYQIGWEGEDGAHAVRALKSVLSIAEADVLRAVNIPESAVEVNSVFIDAGFSLFLRQYEMSRNIG
jgi:ribosomal protein S18 acetylase RimI-like enzyme